MDNQQTLTMFDQLATEILLDIFDYLSCNDIIYTFFYFNQRINSILLHHQRYLRTFQLPTTNFTFWQNILPLIESEIECLDYTTNGLYFPLNLFSNLKSIIIPSSFSFYYNQLSLLIESEQFNKLYSLKIEPDKSLENPNDRYCEVFEEKLLKKVLNNSNTLKIFIFFSHTSPYKMQKFDNFPSNLNIQSLSLTFRYFQSAISILNHTPNLKYFDVILTGIHILDQFNKQLDFSHIKLKKFSLIIDKNASIFYYLYTQDIFNLINFIKQFSSSLIYLSLNFNNARTIRDDNIPFNHGIKLQQQLLEFLIELKKFYFFIKLPEYPSSDDPESILLTFKNDFWFDHHWLIGTDGRYLYTLPFHFDQLIDFMHFDHVKSNHSEILNYPWVWNNVTSIELSGRDKHNLNLLKQFEVKMPKLKSIKFNSDNASSIYHTSKINVKLYGVTNIKLNEESLANLKRWSINVLPNVKYLTVNYEQCTLSKYKLYKFVRRSSELRQLTNNIYASFPNIEHIRISTSDIELYHEQFDERDIINILTKFANLKTISFCRPDYLRYTFFSSYFIKQKFIPILTKLNSNQMSVEYQFESWRNCIQFTKTQIQIDRCECYTKISD
jgi:hypothetical protein